MEAGSDNDLEVFSTTSATVPGDDGRSGVIAGAVDTILAFIGFETAAPLEEEAKDPGRTIGRAVILSCIGIGHLNVLKTYAAIVFFGPERVRGVPDSPETPTRGMRSPVPHEAQTGCWWTSTIASSAIAISDARSSAATTDELRGWAASTCCR